MAIREATENDLDDIVDLIKELAIYEKAEDQARASAAGLRTALFCEHPKVFCLIAETDAGSAGEGEGEGDGGAEGVGEGVGEGRQIAGFALYFYNFSTWEGVHGLYLEDLFVRPAFRGQGFGGALLRRLAQLTRDNGFARMEWVVLNWNAPAIAVYDRIGGKPLDEWTTYRLTGDELTAFAAG